MLHFLQQFDELYKNLRTKWKHWFLFLFILSLGIFARTWEYRSLPPGIFTDEASIGVDSYSVYKYGMDRNGVTYPTEFIAFGPEQNALYGYMLIPLLAIFGLKPIIVRLPMLIYGILTLPLVYFVVKDNFDENLGLLSMFFLSISPWHILLSRWGLDQNFFPFMFLLAYACLLATSRNNKWFILACVLFALCFYIYGPSYFIVPVFLTCSIWILIKNKLIYRQYLIIGLSIFCLLAIPILVFLTINAFKFNAIHIGPVTIPRMPGQPHFLSASGGFQTNLFQTLLNNLWILLTLLFKQTDGLIYNAFEPYGYFYKITFPFALFGIILLFKKQTLKPSVKNSTFLCWVISCLVFGVLQPVNINRINIIFIPLLICIATAFIWLGDKIKPILPIAICSFFIAFIAFTIDYHGEVYKEMADNKFHLGLLSAIQYASAISHGPICVTDKVDMPYIYVLFVEKPNPNSYLNSMVYIDSPSPFRQVRSLLRYTFGKQNCINGTQTVYVLASDEIPPHLGNRYNYQFFENFVVYFPKS